MTFILKRIWLLLNIYKNGLEIQYQFPVTMNEEQTVFFLLLFVDRKKNDKTAQQH